MCWKPILMSSNTFKIPNPSQSFKSKFKNAQFSHSFPNYSFSPWQVYNGYQPPRIAVCRVGAATEPPLGARQPSLGSHPQETMEPWHG